MFNAEVEKIYDPKTVAELKRWAILMEQKGKHVLLDAPANKVDGMIFPCAIGIENHTPAEDDQEIYEMCMRITEGRPFFETDDEWMIPGDYSTVAKIFGGIELWVK